MDGIKFLRAGNELANKVKEVKLDGNVLKEAVHYADIEFGYVVVWDWHTAGRDTFLVLHGVVEIVWKED
jgi:hypothetical protein